MAKTKNKNLTIPLPAKIWSNCNSHKLLLRMQSCMTILEHSLAISYKIEHTLTIQLKRIHY